MLLLLKHTTYYCASLTWLRTHGSSFLMVISNALGSEGLGCAWPSGMEVRLVIRSA